MSRDLESVEANPSSATVQPPETIEGWVWCGTAGHFVGARHCRMFLNTRVGGYRVSTVGDYYPPNRHEDKPTEIGAFGRLYETYVFRVEGFGEHGEGSVVDWSEVDSDGYTAVLDAERGHMQMCLKYDRIARQEARDARG